MGAKTGEGKRLFLGKEFAGFLVERIEYAFYDRKVCPAQLDYSGIFLGFDPWKGAQVCKALSDCGKLHRQFCLAPLRPMLSCNGFAGFVE